MQVFAGFDDAKSRHIARALHLCYTFGGMNAPDYFIPARDARVRSAYPLRDFVRAPSIMHGKLSSVRHDGKTIFANLKNPFAAMRYHSLVIERATGRRYAEFVGNGEV